MEGQALTVPEQASDNPLPAQPAVAPRPKPAAPAAPTAPRPHLVLPALATAGLLWLCYFPVAWGWLAWVALVPLLSLVRAETRGRRVFLCAWLGGLAFFTPALQWMRVADYRMYYTWAMLAVYCSLYFPVAVRLLRRLDRGTRLPLVVTLPAVWVGLEFLRSFLLTGFAWYYLGHSQHDVLPLIQVADLGGAYAVSLLVAAVNAWAFELLYGCDWFRALLGLSRGPNTPKPLTRRGLIVQGAVVVGLITAALVYGACRLEEDAFTPGPRLALLQGNLDQRIRNVDLSVDNPEARGAQETIYNHYGNLELLAKFQSPRPDLIVWPETSFPDSWFEIAPEVPMASVSEKWRDRAEKAYRDMRTYARGEFKQIPGGAANILFGLLSEVVVDPSRAPYKYNSALLLYETGARGGRYDKIHRIPFGEYVPFRDWLPWMDAFAPYETDYSIRAGKHMTRFTLDKYRFGVLICYEDTDPFLARPYGVAGTDGPPVDFLVNISNDGWFDGSSEHDQHLAIARFRAVEARRSVARAVNMGISAVIDGNGRVLKPGRTVHLPDPKKGDEAPYVWLRQHGDPVEDLSTSEWGRYKKVRGLMIADIPIDGRTSLYSLWGDWLGGTCWAVVGVGLVWSAVTRWRRRRGLAIAGGAA